MLVERSINPNTDTDMCISRSVKVDGNKETDGFLLAGSLANVIAEWTVEG